MSLQPPTERAGKPAHAVVIVGAPCSSVAHDDTGSSWKIFGGHDRDRTGTGRPLTYSCSSPDDMPMV